MLFPPQEDSALEQPRESTLTTEWSTEWDVTKEELWEATRKMTSRNVASGLDGIPGRVWREAIGVVVSRLRHLYNRRLRDEAYGRDEQ